MEFNGKWYRMSARWRLKYGQAGIRATVLEFLVAAGIFDNVNTSRNRHSYIYSRSVCKLSCTICLAFSLTSLLLFGSAHAAFLDPLDTPAVNSLAPASEPLLAVVSAGVRLVAVGSRGVILTSNASANSWVQASVPVESDLVAVTFPDAKNGWACGHDGIILHSSDGGITWVKQLDGISARQQFEADYNARIAGGDKALAPVLQQVQLNYDAGPSLPWLGVWFNDSKTGYVVGSFGDIAMTDNGGKTWQPWLDHIDNTSFLDLDAISDVGGHLYIVGEQGTVYQLDRTQHKFVARPTGYPGSLFGIIGTAKTLLVFGLRGTIFRSEDQGKTWTQVNDPSGSTIMNGTVLPDGCFVLVNVDGGILVSSDDGKNFQMEPDAQDTALTDVAGTSSNKLILTGIGGIRYAVQK
jgi:photosystem II stability/assembly factor-like uncharacterized protein